MQFDKEKNMNFVKCLTPIDQEIGLRLKIVEFSFKDLIIEHFHKIQRGKYIFVAAYFAELSQLHST